MSLYFQNHGSRCRILWNKLVQIVRPGDRDQETRDMTHTVTGAAYYCYQPDSVLSLALPYLVPFATIRTTSSLYLLHTAPCLCSHIAPRVLHRQDDQPVLHLGPDQDCRVLRGVHLSRHTQDRQQGQPGQPVSCYLATLAWRGVRILWILSICDRQSIVLISIVMFLGLVRDNRFRDGLQGDTVRGELIMLNRISKSAPVFSLVSGRWMLRSSGAGASPACASSASPSSSATSSRAARSSRSDSTLHLKILYSLT